jgi:hypothetical protein
MSTASPTDAQTVALRALVATLSDERRARRFLDLTGIGTEELRRRGGEPALLCEVIGFLEAHEPDLVSVSETIGLQPEALVAARRELQTDKGAG